MPGNHELPEGDEKYYLLATHEFDTGRRNEALWAKVLALCEGDEQRARFRYIQLRAQQFIDASQARARPPEKDAEPTASADPDPASSIAGAQSTTLPPPVTEHPAHPHTDPPAESGSPAGASRYRFVDPEPLTNWVRALLVLGLIVTLISFWSNYQKYQFLNDFKTGAYTSQAQLLADADAHDERQRLVYPVSIGLFIVTAIVFLKWVYRLNANL